MEATSSPQMSLTLRRSRRQRGSSILEFSMLLPVLLMLALGALEFSRIYLVKRHLETAARAGARTGVVRGATVADVDDAVGLYLSQTQVGDGYSLDTSGVSATSNPDNDVTVKVGYDLPLMTGVELPGLDGSAVPLSASVTMRHQ